jgi:hypothetical protein
MFERFLKVLRDAQEQRPQRQEIVGNTYGWVIYERTVMFEEVNKVRTERGKPLVGMYDIVWYERMALGQSDYSRKFALYCAELARAD